MPGHIKLVKGAVDPDPTEFLLPSMAFNTANAFDIVSRLDRDATLQEVVAKQKAATGLLLDKLH